MVASSATDALARAAGFAVVSLDDLALKRNGPHDGGASVAPPLLDLAVDGADEVDPRLDLIKGGGGALLRERLVARAAKRFLIVVEDDKLTTRLGERHPLPVEIVRFGWRETRRSLLELVPAAQLRRGADGRAFVTDEGHVILDCTLESTLDPTLDRTLDRALEGPPAGSLGERGEGLAALAAALKALPGVVDHGLFLGMADEVVVGHADGGVERRLRGA